MIVEGSVDKVSFFYQMAACDINGDGEKEIIIAGGNKKDVLELRVLSGKEEFRTWIWGGRGRKSPINKKH